ncbi:MAG: tetratricopeptide repeat protein [Desulfohalobiaceae bacterium]
MFKLRPCPKHYSQDQDKAVSPEQTVLRVQKAFAQHGSGILQETRRIDSGRLGIPVYLSICGEQARQILPSRKQMGKGACQEQAQASALMELAERFSLFSFLQSQELSGRYTWSQAQNLLQGRIIPMQEILLSVHEDLDPEQARELMDLVPWSFVPGLDIDAEQTIYLPLDWFRKLNEFNGSSAGNTLEESVLQGACELIERHVCAIVDRSRPCLPSINPDSLQDPVLRDLYSRFEAQGIALWLKDFSLNLGVPTVGALAYDPATLGSGLSEIVFTAGTATSPEKAAIRALTEVAQLGGDFKTGSKYEPSGLSKPPSLEDCAWLRQGETVDLHSLPDVSSHDISLELKHLAGLLRKQGYTLYAVDTTHPQLQIPSNYNIVPGFLFRERAPRPSLGLFVGRILAEEAEEQQASHGLQLLARHYPGASFLPFFQGLLHLRCGSIQQALENLKHAEGIQPGSQEQALVLFYLGYAYSLVQEWLAAANYLQQAVQLHSDVHAYFNLLGVARYKLQDYEHAAKNFQRALELDQGSALDMANLGLCYKQMDRPLAAMDFLQSSLELDPELEFAARELRQLQGMHSSAQA